MIDARIKELGDWRGKTLAKVRKIMHEADPEIVEEWKWGNPVWSHGGLVSTGETYKHTVKMTFARGAALKDPSGLFNSSILLNRIRYRGEEFVVERAGEAICRMTPATPAKALTLRDLASLLRELPKPDAGYASDVRNASRSQGRRPRSPWGR